jgi:hypothetical protein
MATKFVPSAKLALAISRVMENEPKDWGAVEHLAMMRYLLIECSTQAKAVVGNIEVEVTKGDKKVKEVKRCLQLDGKEVTEVTVNLELFKKEVNQAGKLAECANFKRFLSDDYPQFKTAAEKKTEYA